MGSALLRRIALAALVAGVFVGPAGCAAERDVVNTSQPLAIKKSDLIGDYRNPTDAPEFYMRSLITGVARTNPWVSDGLQDMLRRVRFEVTQDHLIARNAYEFIKDSDGHGGPRGKINNGPIVGKWAITRHFDIRNGYNAGTGEVNNVTEENDQDRPWYEREYMRVDWSRNLVEDPNTIFFWESFSGELKFGNLQYNESEHRDEEERSNFNEISNGYFDLNSRWLATPQTFDYYGYAFPACFMRSYNLYQGTYNADPSIDCNEQEMTIRTAFSKVPVGDKSTDYETGEVTSWQGDIVGTITLDRSGYDRQYGITDESWHKYLQRYNIWQKSHTTADCGNEPERTAAAANATCAATNVNSVCDRNAGKCTIPYTDRKVRPIAFFVDPALPKALYPQTARSLKDWSNALKNAVSYAREAECRRAANAEDLNSESARETCHAKFFEGPVALDREDVPKGDEVVVMCHNPVEKGDSPFCGAEGRKVRKGDIREHMITWWSNPSFSRPLGVIVPSGDPLTGENIGTAVNIFGASVETYSARARDQVMLTNGDLTPSEYVGGVTQAWYGDTAPIYDTDPKREPELDALSVKFKNGGGNALTPQDAQHRLENVAPQIKAMADRMGFTSALANVKGPARVKAYDQFVARKASEAAPGFRTRGEVETRIAAQAEKLRTNGMEPKVMNDLWLSSAGVDPKFAGESTVKQVMSPLQGMSLPALSRTDHQDEMRKSLTHMCEFKAPEFLTFNWTAGFSAKMKAKYADGTVASGPFAKAAGVEGATIDRIVRGRLIFQELLTIMYEDTLLHEMGHLMSMEHAFTGTWDSPNYHPEYWILRANGSKNNAGRCPAQGRAPGSPDNCMGPRWLDPQTDEEKGIVKGREHDSADSYAVSSVMDYKFDALHASRLGYFDRMAAKYIYTGIVELMDDEKHSLVPEGTGKSITPGLTIMNAANWYVVPGGPLESYDLHYTEYAQKLNLFDEKRCHPQTPEEKAEDRGQLGITCVAPHKDHMLLRDSETVNVASFGLTVQYGKQKGSSGKYRWPYKVSNGQTAYYHGYYYDNGGDIYEITLDLLDRYEMMYLDYFYRKNSRERNVNNAGNGMFGRFYDRVQSLQWNTLSDVVRAGGLSGTPATLGYMDQANELALTMLFDAMQKSLLRPQPGDYELNKQPGALFDLYSNPEVASSKNPAFKLGAGDSRYIDHQFDLTKQFDYRAYAYRSGSFLEKPFASIALTDARPQLSTVARETYLDGRNVMFSFRSAIPEAFDRLVAGIMADDFDTVAGYVDTADAPDAFGMRPLKTAKLWEIDPSKITRPATARLVDPMLGFRVKVPTMVLMMLYQPIDSDMSLIQRTRLWVTGGQEQVIVPETEKVTFFDPVDGMEWNSRTFGTETLFGKVVDKGIGARMIQHANELLVAAYDVDTVPVVGSTLGQVVPKYINGRPVKGVTPITAANVKDQVAAAKLRSYVAFLNQVRSTLFYLGFGSCGRGQEC
ncbi:MAG: hypothetical protein U0174_21555 [Polyangiaceae bacterium]